MKKNIMVWIIAGWFFWVMRLDTGAIYVEPGTGSGFMSQSDCQTVANTFAVAAAKSNSPSRPVISAQCQLMNLTSFTNGVAERQAQQIYRAYHGQNHQSLVTDHERAVSKPAK